LRVGNVKRKTAHLIVKFEPHYFCSLRNSSSGIYEDCGELEEEQGRLSHLPICHHSYRRKLDSQKELNLLHSWIFCRGEIDRLRVRQEVGLLRSLCYQSIFWEQNPKYWRNSIGLFRSFQQGQESVHSWIFWLKFRQHGRILLKELYNKLISCHWVEEEKDYGESLNNWKVPAAIVERTSKAQSKSFFIICLLKGFLISNLWNFYNFWKYKYSKRSKIVVFLLVFQLTKV